MYQLPSFEHLLGTDHMGRDILAQIIVGSRDVLFVALLTGFLTTLIAVGIGSVAGFTGGFIDTLLMGVAEFMLTIPNYPLLVVVAALIRKMDRVQLSLLLSILAWAPLSRAIRSQIMSLKQKDFVEASISLGMGVRHTIFREIVPNMMPYIATSFLIAMTSAIYNQVGLFYLGFLPFETFNWGVMLNQAYIRGALFYPSAMFYIISPIIAIAMFQVGSFMFLRSIEEIFNPRESGSKVEQIFQKKESTDRTINIDDSAVSLDDSTNDILRVKSLSVQYLTRRGRVNAILNVSMNLRKGETVAIVGESGSGKTTLGLSLIGLLPENAVIKSGKILFKANEIGFLDIINTDPESLREVRWKKISMIFQSALNCLNPVLTVYDHFSDTAKAHNAGWSSIELKKRSEELLKLVQLDAERVLTSYPHELSGGMKQRVSIALALLLNPEMLILDEPTTALDVISQKNVLNVLKRIKSETNLTMMFITHDLSLAADIADIIAVMYAGRIVELGTVRDIFYNPKHPYTMGLLKAIPSIISDVSLLKSISGSPPDLIDLPSGCAFHPRCEFRKDICVEREPPLEVVEGIHKVACHRWRYLE